jgi:hypothetical protein
VGSGRVGGYVKINECPVFGKDFTAGGGGDRAGGEGGRGVEGGVYSAVRAGAGAHAGGAEVDRGGVAGELPAAGDFGGDAGEGLTEANEENEERMIMKTMMKMVGLIGVVVVGLQAEVVTFTNRAGRVWTNVNVGVLQDVAKRKNEPGAWYVLGEYYLAQSAATNFFMATNCFRRAIGKGSGLAAWAMVGAHERVRDFDLDERRGLTLMAANTGVVEAMVKMADLDRAGAVGWLDKAVRAGNTNAAVIAASRCEGKERVDRFYALGGFGNLAMDAWKAKDATNGLLWAMVARELDRYSFYDKKVVMELYREALAESSADVVKRVEAQAKVVAAEWRRKNKGRGN